MAARHDDLDRYRKAFAAARAQLAAATAALDALPAYVRQAPAGTGQARDPRLAQRIAEAESLRRDAQRHRAALAGLQRDLDERDRFAQPAEAQRADVAARAWLDRVRTATQLLNELAPDPRRAYEGSPMSVPTAAALLAARDALGTPTADLAAVVAKAGAQAADLADLASTGRLRCDAVGTEVAVGVMLPLRIETRFRAPDDTRPEWQLRVRVFPESASLDRSGGPVRPSEADALRRFWREIDGDLAHPNSASAFHILADAVGPPRGAWLVRAVPVRRSEVDGPIDIDPVVVGAQDLRSFQQAVGLPDRLEVWAVRGGRAPARIATMAQLDRAALGQQADLHRQFVVDDVAADDVTLPETWWLSYEEAKRIGLAVDIDVGVVPPADIDVLYVVGMGGEGAAPLFESHAAAGSLAVLAPGTPTNTVEGEPAADLGRDPARWLANARRTGLDQPSGELVARALTGGRARLGALDGGDLDLAGPATAVVAALWPALWNRDTKDFWGGGRAAWEVGRWAARFLAPEGPYPAIRIGEQPYGLLPATSLARFVAHASDPPAERVVRKWAEAARAIAAEAATQDGNVVGATAERFLDLLAHVPVSPRPGWRYRLPLELERLLLLLAGVPATMSALEHDWDKRAQALLAAGLRPSERLTPHGPVYPWNERLTGGDPRKAIDELLRAPAETLAYTPDVRWRVQPLPLLARLLRHALILTNAELNRVGEAITNGTLAALDARLALPDDDAYRLAQLAGHDIGAAGQKTIEGSGDPLALAVQDAWYATRDAGAALLGHEPARLDAVLRATLDTASHRVDPWVTGVAERRLRWLAARGAKFRLGAYGWVDAPRPYTGAPDAASPLRPGPTDAGLLHAPSTRQALAAALLRDRAVRDPADSTFDLTLDSASIRAALRVADWVRSGVHLGEALGLEVERIAGDPATVLALRQAFPMRPEHGGRRVCDGQAVLADAVSGAPSAIVGPLVGPLRPLQDALDTYGDLLVVDAVDALVGGRGDLAAPAMEAAAGLGPPPDLRVLRTQRGARAVTTIVLAALPAAAAPANAGPAEIADPAFAARVRSECGAPELWTWQLRTAMQAPVPVTLADAGLAPVDVVSLPDAAIARALRAVAGAAADAAVVSTGGQDRVAVARRLAAMLAGEASLPDFRTEPTAGVDVNAQAAQSLAQRMLALVGAAGALSARLALAPTPADRLLAARWQLPGDDTAAATLGARIAAVQPAASGDTAALRRALRALSGHAALPVLPVVARALLPANLQVSAPLDGRPALDRVWLEVAAAVRAPLARLEAHQYARQVEGAAPWAAWTTNPANPWQPYGDDAAVVTVYGPEGTPLDDPQAQVAVASIDRLAEAIPAREHATAAAFGFNAPKARAPQALLLAVPPDLDAPLDAEALVAIVDETRMLARARAALPDTLRALDLALPMPVLLATGPAAVDHDAG
ncbi:MAG: hypothetical protein U1F10_15535 [Burkholderiales bacterium]